MLKSYRQLLTKILIMERVYDGCLPKQFKLLISGSSNTGKSTLISRIIANENGLMVNDFENIIYVQGVETKSSSDLKEKYGEKMTIFHGIPPSNIILNLCKSTKQTVLILEDVIGEACDSPLISKIFTAYSHHYNFCVILSLQNIFCPGRERLTLIRNATHLILFPNYLDLTVIRTLAQRVYPKNPKKLVELFEHLTKLPFGYLSIWGNCDSDLKFRTDITETKQRVFALEEKNV